MMNFFERGDLTPLFDSEPIRLHKLNYSDDAPYVILTHFRDTPIAGWNFLLVDKLFPWMENSKNVR